MTLKKPDLKVKKPLSNIQIVRLMEARFKVLIIYILDMDLIL